MLFHNGRRNHVHRGLMGDSLVRTIIALNSGLFCNANLSPYFLVLEHLGPTTRDTQMLVVSKAGVLAMGHTRGVLSPRGMSHLCRLCVGCRSMRSFTGIIALSTVTTGSCSLSPGGCIRCRGRRVHPCTRILTRFGTTCRRMGEYRRRFEGLVGLWPCKAAYGVL